MLKFAQLRRITNVFETEERSLCNRYEYCGHDPKLLEHVIPRHCTCMLRQLEGVKSI
jgi:hypothetical protein